MSHVTDDDTLEFKSTLPADYVGEFGTASGPSISGSNSGVKEEVPHVADKISLEFKSTLPSNYMGEFGTVSGPVDNGFTLM